MWDPDIYGRGIGEYVFIHINPKSEACLLKGLASSRLVQNWLLSTLASWCSLLTSSVYLRDSQLDLSRSSTGIANWIKVIQIKVGLLRLLIHQLRQGKHSRSSWKRSSLGPSSVQNPVQISVHESCPEFRVQLFSLRCHKFQKFPGACPQIP